MEMLFVWKFIFIDINISTPTYLCFLIYDICLFLTKYVPCKHHILCSLIHFDNLCLLIQMFGLLTFDVMSNTNLSLAMFFTGLLGFCSSVLPFLFCFSLFLIMFRILFKVICWLFSYKCWLYFFSVWPMGYIMQPFIYLFMDIFM